MSKKVYVYTSIIFLLLCGCATSSGNSDVLSFEQAIEQSAIDIISKLPSGVRVAIVAFSSEHENLSEYFMDELTGALVGGNLEVADRRNLAFVYRELELQLSGEVSGETAVSMRLVNNYYEWNITNNTFHNYLDLLWAYVNCG